MPNNNTKLVPAICTQCGGQNEVNPSQERLVCNYCGMPFFVEKAIHNYSVQNARFKHVESVNINKRGAVESVLNFVEKQQDKKQQKIDEEKRRQEEEKRRQEEEKIKQKEQINKIKDQTFNKKFRKRNLWIIAIVAIAITFCCLMSLLMGLLSGKPNHEGEAKTPSGSSFQKGKDYKDVVAEFEENGFKNIKTETLEDLILGWITKDGEVESVLVDGDEDYSSYVWYPNDVEVVITYHTFLQHVESTPTTSNGGNSEPIEQPTDEPTKENLIEDNSELIELSTEEPTKEISETVEQFTDEPTKENSQEILTIENNEDMAALFKTSDDDPFVSLFAKKYSGRTIQFDGYIANLMPHGNYKTRFDILIYTGNYGLPSGNALSFKFEDINIVWDLKLTGSNIPDYIGEGQNLRITAKVEEYNEIQGLFFLKPVSTEIR